jgi:hypothetical protein
MGAMGILVFMFLRFHFGVSDLESKITGIWSNKDDSMRILIYNIDSVVQGEVVWTDNNNDKILGTTIIRNMHLTFFGWSKGTYIDPHTREQVGLKLKLKSTEKLCLQFMDNSKMDSQHWKLVK